jgi:excisionase family DNA binding protein
LTSKTKAVRPKASANPKKPLADRDGAQLLTPAECADVMGVTERQIRRLILLGKLRKTKVEKLVRVHVDDLNEYIESRRGYEGQ